MEQLKSVRIVDVDVRVERLLVLFYRTGEELTTLTEFEVLALTDVNIFVSFEFVMQDVIETNLVDERGSHIVA